MPKSNPFKWRHYQTEIILLCVRWYLTYPMSVPIGSRDGEREGRIKLITQRFTALVQQYGRNRQALPTLLATDKRLVASGRNL